MALEFRRGFDLLNADSFYEHRTWNNVSPPVENEIDAIGIRADDRLWGLDDKLAQLLDADMP